MAEELKERRISAAGAEKIEKQSIVEAYVPEYSESIREGLLGREERTRTDQDILNKYRRMMEDRESIPDMVFEYGNRMEGLSRKEGGVTIIMPTREAVDDTEAEKENPWIGGGYMNRCYAVKIVGVDDDTKTVTVSHREAKAEYKGFILSDIRKALENGKHPIVKARVKALPVHYERDENKNTKRIHHSVLTASKRCTAAILEIEGVGINGWLSREDFMDCYVPDLIPFLRVGDVIDVAVVKENDEPYYGKDGKGKPQPVFTCSRKEAVPSCWKDLHLKRGANVVLTCIARQDSAWTGVTNEKTITYRCFYPRIPGLGQIKVGKRYCGRIDEFDPVKHILNVSITQECSSIGE